MSSSNSNKRVKKSIKPDYCTVSEYEEETFSFLWIVQNFKSIFDKDDFWSPTFNGGGHTWQLKLEAHEESKKLEGVFVFLKKFGNIKGDPPADPKVKLRMQFSLLDENDQPKRTSVETSYEFSQVRQNWGFGRFISAQMGSSEEVRILATFWNEGTLKHKIKTHSEYKKRKSSPPEPTSQSRLGKDYKNLYSSGEFSDVTVFCAGPQSFKAHKNILSTRCEVFARMLSSDMIEAKKNEIKIEDFGSDIVDAMLEFIYSDHIEKFEGNYSDLMKIGDKYGLIGLVEFCEEALSETINTNNCAEIYTLAHFNNANTLKNRALEYITRNFNSVKKTESFMKQAKDHSSLFVELLFN